MNQPHSTKVFRFSVAVVAVLGLLGIAGWLGHITALQGVAPEWATMKPITCFSFLFSALALGLFEKPGLGTRVAQVISLMLLAVGILSLQHNLLVDKWLMARFGGSGEYAMAPNTSICFALSGLAIFFSPMKSALRCLTQPLAALVAMVALVAICGYLVNAESLYTVSGFGTMAFNTSVAFGGLAIGTFATQPRLGIMRIWSQDNASGATLRRLLPVVAGLPLLVAWISNHGVIAGFFDGEFALALTISSCSALIGAYAIWGANLQGIVEESLIQQRENERFVLEFSEHAQGFSKPDDLVAHVCEALREKLGLDECTLALSGYPTTLQTHHEASDSPLKPAQAVAFAIAPVPIGQPAAALVVSVNNERKWSAEDLRLLADATETLWLLRERCAAAAALQASEHDLTLTMNSITDGIITTDEDGRVKRLNPMASWLLGLAEGELIGSPLSTVFPLDDLKIPGEIGDHQVVNSDGQSRHIRGRISIVEGGTFGMVVVFRDVQEEYFAQMLLQESEARKSAILRSAFDPIVSMNHHGDVVEFNEAAERVFGYTRSEAMGRCLADLLIPPRLRGSHTEGLARFLDTDTAQMLGKVVEVPAMHRDGTEIPAEIAIMKIPGQEPPIFTAIIRDLRIRKQADEQFKVAMESAPVGMILVDNQGKISLVNKRVEAIFGYTRPELLGSPVEMLIPSRFVAQHPTHREMFHFNPVARLMGERDIYGATKDGLEVPLEIALNPVETAEGRFVLCSVEDITTRKRQEDERKAMVSQLRVLNAELGRGLGEREVLLQEVHHRVKNNLQVISSLMSIQARSVEDANACAALLECRTRVEAISLIHEKLYQSKDYAEVPFDVYVSELVANIADAIGTGLVRITADVENFPLSINRAIPCGLVINELVTNAMRHAFPPGSPGEIKVSMQRTANDRVELTVADNGVGMDDDAGRPNSLGLNLVSTLIRQLRGELSKTTDAGTTFRVTFPMHDEESV